MPDDFGWLFSCFSMVLYHFHCTHFSVHKTFYFSQTNVLAGKLSAPSLVATTFQ